MSAIATIPSAEPAAALDAAPSRLSIRLKALTASTIQNTVSTSSVQPGSPVFQPAFAVHTLTPTAAWTASLTTGDIARRSSTVPSRQIATAPQAIIGIGLEVPAETTDATSTATRIASPPRDGVGRAWRL